MTYTFATGNIEYYLFSATLTCIWVTLKLNDAVIENPGNKLAGLHKNINWHAHPPYFVV